MSLLSLGLRAAPFWLQLAFYGAIAAAAIGAYALWHHKVYRSGYDAAIADVAADNQEAVNAAETARSRVRDCHARGMRWDQIARQCQ